jgi:hypothetical protein
MGFHAVIETDIAGVIQRWSRGEEGSVRLHRRGSSGRTFCRPILDFVKYWINLLVMVGSSTHDPQLLQGLLSFVLLHLLAEQEPYG